MTSMGVGRCGARGRASERASWRTCSADGVLLACASLLEWLGAPGATLLVSVPSSSSFLGWNGDSFLGVRKKEGRRGVWARGCFRT